jgi:prevent-host-death family protein
MYIEVYMTGTGKRQSIAEARNNLPRLVREVETGALVELTRRGESVAVLLGRRDYERMATARRRFSEAWSEFSRKVDLAKAAIDPDEVFGDARDTRPGRDVDV